MPTSKHISDWKQWQVVVDAGRLTNAQWPKKKKSSSAAGSSSEDAQCGDCDDDKGERGLIGKRQRARAWPFNKDDANNPWPEARFRGRHDIAFHNDGSQHLCDYPQCNLVHTSWVPPPAASKSSKKKAKIPALPQGLTARPNLAALHTAATPPTAKGGGKAKAKAPDPRASSPAPSDDSNASGSSASGKKSRTRLYCLNCFDVSRARCMNFHPECYNKWHFDGRPGDC